jgi:hypothetical protein
MYDYIIIGGGISGLYMNSLLVCTNSLPVCTNSKKYKTLLLEKNNYLGGRALETKFHNEYIKHGAGIASLHNTQLLSLLKKLKIKYQILDADTNLLFTTKFDMKKATKKIIKIYKIEKKKKNEDIYAINVKQFIEKYISKKFFNEYDKQTEYKDYMKTNMDYYINHYPIKDNIPEPYILIALKWKDLIDKLYKIIKYHNQDIKLNYNVEYITYDKVNECYMIDNKYCTKKIIFATTLNGIQGILNNSTLLNINYNKYLGSVSFVKIYTYHKNGHNLKNNIDIDDYNITDNKLSKIIIINKNMLVLTYSDNGNAHYWYNLYNTDKEKLIDKLKELCKKSTGQDIEIDDIKFIYWNEGVHYFKPRNYNNFDKYINSLAHPCDNIYVIGEMLSYKQGWVEGAIESANRIYKIIKKDC